MALEICADPSLEQRVRNPNWVKHDLDEFLRMGTPVGTFGRVATRDVERLTGYRFFSTLPDDLAEALRDHVDQVEIRAPRTRPEQTKE